MTTESEVQKAILEVIYDSSSSLITSFLTRGSVIEEVTERYDDLDETEVEYQLTILEEDWLVKRDGSTIQMGWQGLERYEELGGNTNLSEELQEEILGNLLDQKKANPRHPYIAKEELISNLGKSESVVTENVWILREVGNVELRQAIGSDFISAAITKAGRRALERSGAPDQVGGDQIDELIQSELRKLFEEQGESAFEELSEKSESEASDIVDAFICHASEDKDAFVEPLAHELREMGLDVWYDDFKFEIGDNIRREIDRGLANSRYGIVVLSEHFFEKEWPQRELDALAEKEVDEKKVILPVWYEVDKEFVKEYSLQLANRFAGLATEENIPEVAEQLQAVIED